MKTTLFMIRHAQSPFIFGQERTRELSERGKLDANKITEQLKQETIDVIVSSPYKRAIQTIEGIANEHQMEITIFEGLKERPIKGAYKLSAEEIEQAIKKSYDDKDYCLPGGETTRQAQERAIPVIKQLLTDYEGKSIVVGTHGNIMTIMMNYFDEQYGYDFWINTSKPDIYKLIFNDDVLVAVERVWEQDDAA